jgi:hypothetical protein
MPFIGQSLPDSKSLTRRAQWRRTLRNQQEQHTEHVGFASPQYVGTAVPSAVPTQISRVALALPG